MLRALRYRFNGDDPRDRRASFTLPLASAKMRCGSGKVTCRSGSLRALYTVFKLHE